MQITNDTWRVNRAGGSEEIMLLLLKIFVFFFYTTRKRVTYPAKPFAGLVCTSHIYVRDNCEMGFIRDPRARTPT